MNNVSFSLGRPRARFVVVAPDNAAFASRAPVASVVSAAPLFLRQAAAPEIVPPSKEMTWGEPTWLFLHTMAEKVREERFAEIRAPMLNMLYMVCTNLPCPTCAEHAKEYMNSLNFSAIQSKQKLREFFWNFHNMLNAKKGAPLQSLPDVEEKYARAYTRLVIHNFILSFDKKRNNTHLLANDFYRRRISGVVREWLQSNIASFAD
jgi:hypothetical protein